MRNDTTTSNCRLYEGIKFLVTTDCKLEVTRSNTLHFEVLACIASKLENLGSEVLQYCWCIYCGSGANTLGLLDRSFQKAVDTANRELPWRKFKLWFTERVNCVLNGIKYKKLNKTWLAGETAQHANSLQRWAESHQKVKFREFRLTWRPAFDDRDCGAFFVVGALPPFPPFPPFATFAGLQKQIVGSEWPRTANQTRQILSGVTLH